MIKFYTQSMTKKFYSSMHTTSFLFYFFVHYMKFCYELKYAYIIIKKDY